MDNAWETLKKIFLLLLLFYFVAFLMETNFLIKLLKEEKIKVDFSNYLLKILNIE